MNKTKNLIAGILLSTFFRGGVANADYTLNMGVGVTKISREVHDLHMLVIWICLGIGLLVFSVMFYSFYHHRKSQGAVGAAFHENGMMEILWTLIPFIILISMAVPATRAMMNLDDTRNADMTVKVTGYQWKWRYDYIDEGFGFMSQLDARSNAARQSGSGIDPATVQNYLLNVDHPLVIPVNKKVRLLFTAANVLHAWWVPELGWKKDAVPGFINESWTLVDKPGTYRGQCAELCGRDHGFMPIVVVAKTEAEYSKWLQEQKLAIHASEEPVQKTWTEEELIAKGEEIYNGNCASCHQANGEGIPGTFPAIKGSAVATGALDKHIEFMLNGKGMMPSFSAMLSAADLAAVITFERNAFGNNAGDFVQPSKIAPLIKAPVDDEDE
ncbi:MAG: cytochrome c oxidase subunit II [Methylococcaceae bacterium]|nr:cytochrome c oxidase subunit II [Methylococcaceae bacterium]